MFQLMSQKLYSPTTNKPSSSEVINKGIAGLGGALYLLRNQVMHTNFTPMIAMYFDILRYFTDRPNISIDPNEVGPRACLLVLFNVSELKHPISVSFGANRHFLQSFHYLGVHREIFTVLAIDEGQTFSK